MGNCQYQAHKYCYEKLKLSIFESGQQYPAEWYQNIIKLICKL